jgi:hypothetical protein
MTTNARGASVCGTEPLQNYPDNIIDFPTPDKGLATIKAQLALAGHQVHEGSNNDFIVVKADWNMSRYLADIGALRRFARIVGVSE